ncbi:MAG: hypothetical protein AUK53_10460 [Betaproteobacteria bacterium CG2_30_59_46]|nr:MAG: hypothetical protein AUK53_10460 [Betaproteobacteria bacterium CG2_30_59_46]
MIIVDMPNIPPQQPPIILVKAKSTPVSNKKLYGTVGVCTVQEKASQVASGNEPMNLGVSNSAWQIFPMKFPGFAFKGAITKGLKDSGEGPDFMAFDADGGAITVLQPPKQKMKNQ